VPLEKLVGPIRATSLVSHDGGEPAILFTFYTDFIKAGGTHEQYLALPPLD
jgi:hypothetical protein